MVKLNAIHELIGRALKVIVAALTKELQITARPELSRKGVKPELTKAKLFTRAEQRKKRDADKDGASQR
uniref:Histone H1 n=1 Tax=Haemonchus contortus TaxID=6289 RepID=A0A7I5ECH5_HAECO